MSLLQVEDARVHFRKRGGAPGRGTEIQALRGVSLEVNDGETLGVVGESGCGKSTLARAIVGLQPLTSGAIRMNGEVVSTGGWRRPLLSVRSCQMVFQDPYSSLNPKRTVERIIGEPWEIHRDLAPRNKGTRVKELLEMVGLDHSTARRYPHQLSGGQRQRVGIARALALEPRLLVCDEPVSALDVSIQAQVLDVLRSVQKELGLAYIVIAHDLGVVRQISSRVAVLYLGKVVELGEPSAVYERPTHPYTEALIESIPEVYPWRPGRSAAPTIEPVELPDPTNPPPGCSFADRCAYSTDHCRSVEPPLIMRHGVSHPVACHYPLNQENA